VFVDEARIYVKAGDGGRGCVAFRREKFVPRGGPSGGDGGSGGSVQLVATPHENTLLRFRFNREFRGEPGRHGQGSNCHGKSGADSVLEVPVGTLVYDDETGELLFDFTQPGERFLAARGGRGGRGNQHFAKPWHQAPRDFEDGQPGQERHLRLELRLLADVGLLGLPNAGKSTLISRISAARPKIADYPFTTLEPHLGVVSVDGPRPGLGRSFVVADLPGLIEGAHQGAGLGTRFLRHLERTRLLAHLVDCSGATLGDPVHDFEVVRHELAASSASLAAKPFLVVATKLDATTDRTALEALRAHCAAQGYPFYAISSASGEGVQNLVRDMANALDALPRPSEPASPRSESPVAEPSRQKAQSGGREN
jgi:GTPase